MQDLIDSKWPVSAHHDRGTWMVNGMDQRLVHFRPDTKTSHGQWVELRVYEWIRPQPPVPRYRRRLLRANAIDVWNNMLKVGWRRCFPPVR
ncbi:DUF1651 domain-containing protein [Synechococcus sp. A15-60]|uniref:DUF1651 domain-containing protein n=1 Tax=Synechococcus sp. A15-60 TaxID=1050655 RepID=UPI0016483CA3|nr:DUF1651 domain-containing protein [Synechococcus sp. A15-60]QNI47580.1 conserved hypothetical protein (DUF1651) [Synechococcus sp. A15-60]